MKCKALLTLPNRVVLALAIVGVFCSAPSLAQTPEIRAEAIEVRQFLQQTGTFSRPITESSELWNIIIGSDEELRPSSSTFVRVQVAGPPGSYNSRKSVSLTVTTKGRQRHRKILRKSLGVFSDKGKQFVGFWLPDTGCQELTLVARVSSQSTATSTRIPFACGE
jgi:hypothetical protein